jgi:hypothetical protein
MTTVSTRPGQQEISYATAYLHIDLDENSENYS